MRLQRVTSGGVDSPGLFAAKLPPALVDRLSERLCMVTVIVATTMIALTALGYALQPEFAQALTLPSLRITFVGLLLVSIGVAVVQRRGWMTKPQLLDLTLVYQVVVSFAIGMFETSLPWDGNTPVRGISHVALWFFLCAFLLPNAPLRVAGVALSSIGAWWAAYQTNLAVNGFDPYPANRLLVLIGQMVVTGVWMFLINRRIVSMQLQQYRAEQLGSYEIESKISQGGMGEVWRARHKMLARDAAVKLIRPDVLSSSTGQQEAALLRRFEREAKVTAKLQSPNTVALYDFGRTADGTIYYVMELLNGVDLQTLVDRFGPLHPGRVLNVLAQVCDSLEEAHRAGLVHRDIKPKNIQMAKLGLQYDFVKVLDFGLVKIRQPGADPMVSVEGITAGTPAYMAPEVALGHEEIDGRADLYSLGCVAYFLLTGRTVFEEPSAVAHAIAHAQKQPVPPHEKSELPIPPPLEEVVMRLLEKHPGDRFQSAYDLGRRLRDIRNEVPEFCPYTAAEWWATNLPDATAATAGPDTPAAASDRETTVATVVPMR